MSETRDVVRAVLTDIEGTTSSLAFVSDVLFPYARAHLGAYVRAHVDAAPVREALDAVRAEVGDASLTVDGTIAVLERWIDEDRKLTPLKTLQGFVWEEGYRSRTFVSHMYDDAIRQLRDWHARGLRLYVYSSGSVQAQKLLFGHTAEGDLTPLFSGYFDTTTGPKREAASYAAIADRVGLPPSAILFLSDVPAELDAARVAGMATTCLARDTPPPVGLDHPVAHSFADVRLVLRHDR